MEKLRRSAVVSTGFGKNCPRTDFLNGRITDLKLPSLNNLG